MSVVAARGFAAAGTHLGIKGSGAPDCAVVACTTDTPASAAGVFTSNLAAAAPVLVSRAHLAATVTARDWASSGGSEPSS